MVDVDPAGIAGERARPHEIGRGLRWADVKQVETAGDFLKAAVRPFRRESGFLGGAVHRDEAGFELQIDPIAGGFSNVGKRDR
jgi:hypothetical protein